MIKVFRCYKYKGQTVYINAIVESEESGSTIIIWGNIYRNEGDKFKCTPERVFEKEAVLIEPKK